MSLFCRLACCLLLLGGCAPHLPVFQELPPGGIELVDTPFHAQKEMQCGPAALAMVLRAAGVATDPDRLAPQIFLPGRQGTLQLELVGAVRRHGRLPYVIDPTAAALAAQLEEGRPVLVLQDLGAGPFRQYHYAVLIGMRPDGQVVLRSGTEKRLLMNGTRFARSWSRAGSWGVVVLRPGEIPRDADADRYTTAVAALESLGQWTAAEKGYEAALTRWPDQLTALFGLGNVLLMKKEYGRAEGLFRHFLKQQPDNPAALNNLAEALRCQGRTNEALTVVAHGLAITPLPADLAVVLQQTRRQILDTPRRVIRPLKLKKKRRSAEPSA